MLSIPTISSCQRPVQPTSVSCPLPVTDPIVINSTMSQASDLNESLESNVDSQDFTQKHLPPGQKRRQSSSEDLDTTTLSKAVSSFNAFLLKKNNDEDCDDGVKDVLLTVHVEPFDEKVAKEKLKSNKISKEKLVAAVAFLQRAALSETKKELRSVPIGEVREMFLYNYTLLCPDQCHKCDKVFVCHIQNNNILCLVCKKGLCQDCCPTAKSLNPFLFPVCLKCSNRHAPKETQEEESPTILSSITSTVLATSPESVEATEVNKETPQANIEMKICSYYYKNSCKFGKKGEECKFNHPKPCFKWQKAGPKGCGKGKECEYFHGQICNGSLKDLTCLKEDCRFLHLPKTTRHPPTTVPRVDTHPQHPQSPPAQDHPHPPLTQGHPPAAVPRVNSHPHPPPAHIKYPNPPPAHNEYPNPPPNQEDFRLAPDPVRAPHPHAPPTHNLEEILRTLSAQSALLNSLAHQVTQLTEESRERKQHQMSVSLGPQSFRNAVQTFYPIPSNPHHSQ